MAMTVAATQYTTCFNHTQAHQEERDMSMAGPVRSGVGHKGAMLYLQFLRMLLLHIIQESAKHQVALVLCVHIMLVRHDVCGHADETPARTSTPQSSSMAQSCPR